MTPARPETALSAVIAEMGTAARELHDHGAQSAPVAVAAMVDQLPADAVGVEIADHERLRGRNRPAVVPKGDAAYAGERRLPFERGHQLPRGLLALPAHDRIDVRLLGQDFSPMIGGKHTAIDDHRRGQCRRDGARDFGDHRVAGCRTGMAEQHGIRRTPYGLRHDGWRRHRTELAVQQFDVMTVVDQRSADCKQAERRQVIVRDAAADCGMRHIDEQDAHGGFLAGAVIRAPPHRLWRVIAAAVFAISGGAWNQAGVHLGYADRPEAALAAMEVGHRSREVVAVEVGPHAGGEMKLGIGALPQQKVGEPFLPAGADQQIDIAAGVPRRTAAGRRLRG